MGSALLFAIVWINFFLVFLFFFLFDFCDKVSNMGINVCYTSSIRKNYQGQDFFIVFFFFGRGISIFLSLIFKFQETNWEVFFPRLPYIINCFWLAIPCYH